MRISDWSSDVCSSDLSRSLRQFPRRALQRRIEMRAEFGEDDIVAADAADQHMVGARDPRFGQRGAGERAQPAFHPVADDGVADFLADGEAAADARTPVAARAAGPDTKTGNASVRERMGQAVEIPG